MVRTADTEDEVVLRKADTSRVRIRDIAATRGATLVMLGDKTRAGGTTPAVTPAATLEEIPEVTPVVILAAIPEETPVTPVLADADRQDHRARREWMDPRARTRATCGLRRMLWRGTELGRRCRSRLRRRSGRRFGSVLCFA